MDIFEFIFLINLMLFGSQRRLEWCIEVGSRHFTDYEKPTKVLILTSFARRFLLTWTYEFIAALCFWEIITRNAITILLTYSCSCFLTEITCQTAIWPLTPQWKRCERKRIIIHNWHGLSSKWNYLDDDICLIRFLFFWSH